jgi:hypothetical protein
LLKGKTIQIYLPDGNPRGIRLAEITSRTVQVVEIPRATLAGGGKRPELAAVGVYFLVGPSEKTGAPAVYVGEAEDCFVRLKQHHQQKDFWTTALVAVSKTQYFTKTHVKYLEWYCHGVIQKAARYEVENSTTPTCPFIGESIQADLEDNFETMQGLVSTLGYPMFDELTAGTSGNAVLCKGKRAEARGEWTEEGLVVFEGSSASPTEVPSAEGTWVSTLRRELVEAGILVWQGDSLRFARSHVFSSPSAAAVTVLGGHANGWNEWKFSDGRSLNDLRGRSDGPDA